MFSIPGALQYAIAEGTTGKVVGVALIVVGLFVAITGFAGFDAS